MDWRDRARDRTAGTFLIWLQGENTDEQGALSTTALRTILLGGFIECGECGAGFFLLSPVCDQESYHRESGRVYHKGRVQV